MPRVVLEDFVLRWPPQQHFILLLHGEPGRGKSGMAAAVLREVYEQHGIIGRWTTASSLLNRYHATRDDGATETAAQVDHFFQNAALLVLDDIDSSEVRTEFAEAKLFAVIDWRYSRGLPTILTSNGNEYVLGERVASRLRDRTTSLIVPFDGPDRREMDGPQRRLTA